MVLVANKADLEGERVVSFQDGEGLAQELKVQWNSAEERGSTCHTLSYHQFSCSKLHSLSPALSPLSLPLISLPCRSSMLKRAPSTEFT